MTGVGGPYIEGIERGLRTEDGEGPWGETRQVEMEGKTFAVTTFEAKDKPVRTTPLPQETSSKSEPAKIEEIISPAELALIRALRLCGDEYKKRIYAAAAIRGQNTMEEKELTDEQKSKHRKDLEVLLTTSIE